MDQPAADYELARTHMVDGQIRPNKVNDRRILDAFRSLPRERFVPPPLAPLAYIDEDLPIGGGRVLMEPMVLARLLQLARPRAGERALVVAAGTGYGSAVLALCGVRVTALEEEEGLSTIARQVCAECAPSVTFVSGRLAEGHPAGAPYDLIVIEGAVPTIPPAIAEQVAPGGRLVGVLAAPGQPGHAVLAEPTPAGLHSRPEFDAATVMLPSLAPVPAFTF